MKLRKALLTTGLIATVVAPVATVVSCGQKPELPNEWKKENDEKWNGVHDNTDPKNPIMQQPGVLTFLQNNANLRWYPLAASDIFEYATNSQEDGILPIVRLQDYATKRGMNASGASETWTSIIDDVIDTSVIAENGQPQILEQVDQAKFNKINSFKTIDITKAQIVSDQKLLSKTYKQIENIVNGQPQKFGIFVESLKPDAENDKDVSQGFDQGEYKIHIFKLKSTPSQELDAAIKLFTDKKIAIDKNLFKQLGGTYMTGSGYGTLRFSADENSSVSIFNDNVTILNNSPDFVDRVLGESLKDWTAFGPTASLTDADKQAVKDVKFVAYYQKDRKTQIQNLIVTVATTGANITIPADPNDPWSLPSEALKIENIRSINIPVPEMMEIVPTVDYSKMSDVDLGNVAKSIVEDLSFHKIYGILSNVISLKGMIGSLAPSAMPVVIDLYGVLRTMWETQNVILNLNSFRAFINELPNIDQNFSLSQYMEVVNNQKDKDLEGFTTFGGKRYSVLVVTSRFYNNLKKFLDMHPQYADQTRLVGGQNG